MHEVIHVIHKKEVFLDTFEVVKKEQPFCEEVINFVKKWKNAKMQLTFQKLKNKKNCRKLSNN